MSVINIIIFVLALISAFSAAAVLLVKEVFHAALLLMICLICVAGIFVTFNAEFLAVVQLIVYAGGVLILIVFGIMLTVRNSPDQLQSRSQNEIISSIIGLTLFAIMVVALGQQPQTVMNTMELSPENLGILLMTNFLAPFELAGILLLVCLIGAIVAATSFNEKQPS